MNRNGNHVMAKEYAPIDGTRSTCSDYTELTISVYHPLLRRTLKLCSMFCSGENSRNISKMLSSMDEIKYWWKFPPSWIRQWWRWGHPERTRGFLRPRSERTSQGVRLSLLPRPKQVREVLYEFGSKERFKNLTEKWKTALTPAHYKKSFQELTQFIEQKPEKRGPIKGFVKFWDDRKIRFATCYRPLFNAPGASKAETVNAGTVNAGGRSLALVDAIMHDVASSILLKKVPQR